MTSSTLARGVWGAGISMVGQIIVIVIQLLGTIVLSRLLAPADFGLVAMVAVFMAIGALIRDFGMPTAALAAPSLNDQQASNVFWVSAALSFVAGLLLLVGSPLIVLFYSEPRLAWIVPPMAGILVLNGLQAQYQVRLARSMQFSAVVAISVASTAIAFAVAVLAAVSGWGYWALVVQQAASALVSLLASLLVTRWLPTWPRRASGSMKLVRAGGDVGIANVLGFLADNADTLVIGAVWGSVPLGLYNRAFQLFMYPVNAVFGPLTRVIIPVVNRAVAEGRSAASVLLRVQFGVCGLAVWLLLVTSVTAPWLVPLLLGAQWAEAAPLVQILALGGAFKALSQTNYWAYLVEQQTRQLLTSNLITKPLQILLIVGAGFISVEMVAWAFVLGRALTWPFNLMWLSRTASGYSWPFAANGARLLLSAGLSFFVRSFCSRGCSSPRAF